MLVNYHPDQGHSRGVVVVVLLSADAQIWDTSFTAAMEMYHHLGYERVYLPLCKVADTPFHIQGDGITRMINCVYMEAFQNISHRHT